MGTDSSNGMRIFVTGASGQLGYDVVKELKTRGHVVLGSGKRSSFDSPEYVSADITDTDRIESLLTEFQPDAVIHCASWTAVDMAESEENTVYAINVTATENIARVCKKLDCKLIYISSDYVFDGSGDMPWHAEASQNVPLNVYGRTKLEGERVVSSLVEKFFVVRISWAFGKNGNNFVKAMLDAGKKHDTIRVVCDQIGTPTYTYDLARLLVDMAESDKYGYYHATNEGGYISWYEFACEIFKQAGYDTKVVPVTTEEYGLSKAARPFNSRLDKGKLTENGFMLLPTWQDALNRYLHELGY